MKILIAMIGTRGDVQPYVALGQALMESGHEITICTCAHFEPFVREYGLDYAYVNNDFIDFMHSPEGKIILGNAGSFWETIATLAPMISKLGNLQERQMADVWAASKESAPDLIIYHPTAIGAPDFAEKPGGAMHAGLLAPNVCADNQIPSDGVPRASPRTWVSSADLSTHQKDIADDEQESQEVAHTERATPTQPRIQDAASGWQPDPIFTWIQPTHNPLSRRLAQDCNCDRVLVSQPG
jgi:sterol 3beta-glucosyltransferase